MLEQIIYSKKLRKNTDILKNYINKKLFVSGMFGYSLSNILSCNNIESHIKFTESNNLNHNEIARDFNSNNKNYRFETTINNKIFINNNISIKKNNSTSLFKFNIKKNNDINIKKNNSTPLFKFQKLNKLKEKQNLISIEQLLINDNIKKTYEGFKIFNINITNNNIIYFILQNHHKESILITYLIERYFYLYYNKFTKIEFFLKDAPNNNIILEDTLNLLYNNNSLKLNENKNFYKNNLSKKKFDPLIKNINKEFILDKIVENINSINCERFFTINEILKSIKKCDFGSIINNNFCSFLEKVFSFILIEDKTFAVKYFFNIDNIDNLNKINITNNIINTNNKEKYVFLKLEHLIYNEDIQTIYSNYITALINNNKYKFQYSNYILPFFLDKIFTDNKYFKYYFSIFNNTFIKNTPDSFIRCILNKNSTENSNYINKIHNLFFSYNIPDIFEGKYKNIFTQKRFMFVDFLINSTEIINKSIILKLNFTEDLYDDYYIDYYNFKNFNDILNYYKSLVEINERLMYIIQFTLNYDIKDEFLSDNEELNRINLIINLFQNTIKLNYLLRKISKNNEYDFNIKDFKNIKFEINKYSKMFFEIRSKVVKFKKNINENTINNDIFNNLNYYLENCREMRKGIITINNLIENKKK